MGDSDPNDITNVLDAQKKIDKYLDEINKIRADLTMQYYGIVHINIDIEKVYSPGTVGMQYQLYNFKSKITLDIKK